MGWRLSLFLLRKISTHTDSGNSCRKLKANREPLSVLSPLFLRGSDPDVLHKASLPLGSDPLTPRTKQLSLFSAASFICSSPTTIPKIANVFEFIDSIYSCFTEFFAVPPKVVSYFPSLHPWHLENTYISEDFSNPTLFAPITPPNLLMTWLLGTQECHPSTQSASRGGTRFDTSWHPCTSSWLNSILTTICWQWLPGYQMLSTNT